MNTPATSEQKISGALHGVRVLDLSQGIAGPFAARLLGDHDADVIKVEPPQHGDSGRKLAPLKADAPEPEQSLLFQYLNWNKRSIALDLTTASGQRTLRALVEISDILIESFRPGTLEAWGISVDTMLEWNPRLVVTSITNYGQTGPYARYEASDLTLQAMSGIMAISGQVDREPLKHGLSQSYYCAGLTGAYASIMAYTAAQQDQFGEHVDVSIHECLASELVLNESYYAFLGAVQGRRAIVQDPFAGEPIETRKGYVAFQVGGGAPFETFAELFDRPEFLEKRFTSPPEREKRVPEVRALLEECVAQRDAKEVFLAGAKKRLLLGVVQGASDLLSCEHLEDRKAFANVSHPDTQTDLRLPAELAKLSLTPTALRRRAPKLDEHRDEILVDLLGCQGTETQSMTKGTPTLPLIGMRVLDLSYVFAVPYMAGLLSDLGAEVIKIEAPHKLDQTRGRAFGPYLDNDPAQDPWNRSGIFYVVNRGKRSLAMDMSTPEGQRIFKELVAKSDIVLDNYTPRVMRKWGLHYDELKKIKPSLIMLSNTGYGSTGPWSAFPSQGTTLEATMGITYYTGYRGDKPWKVGQSYPDFIACWAGLNGLWAAISHLRKTGEGQWIDVGMYQLGVAMMPEPFIQYQLDGTEPERIGNEHAEHVPSNLYKTKGSDQWIAITVETDAQWQALASFMQDHDLATNTAYATAASRREYRAFINQKIGNWALQQEAPLLTQRLQNLGIAAGHICNSRDLLSDPHLMERGFYEKVRHHDPVGDRPIIGRPYRLRFRDAKIKKGGPRFGEDNTAILRDIVGMSVDQIDSARANGIISDIPTNPGISGTMNTDMMLELGTLSAVDKNYADYFSFKKENT